MENWNSTNTTIPPLTREVTSILAMGGLSTLLALGLSLSLVNAHLSHFSRSRPTLQLSTIHILLISPLYVLLNLLSLLLLLLPPPSPTPLAIILSKSLSLLRDTYEGICIYYFWRLFLSYLGSTEEERIRKLQLKGGNTSPENTYYLPPPLCGWKFNPSSPSYLPLSNYGILQFLLLKPLISLLSFIFLLLLPFLSIPPLPIPPLISLSLSILTGASMGLAMFTLFTYYLVTYKEISPFNPVSQFMSVKFLIFFNFWIGLALGIYLASPSTSGEVGGLTSSVRMEVYTLLTVNLEMCFASLWHHSCFPVKPFLLPPLFLGGMVGGNGRDGLEDEGSLLDEEEMDDEEEGGTLPLSRKGSFQTEERFPTSLSSSSSLPLPPHMPRISSDILPHAPYSSYFVQEEPQSFPTLGGGAQVTAMTTYLNAGGQQLLPSPSLSGRMGYLPYWEALRLVMSHEGLRKDVWTFFCGGGGGGGESLRNVRGGEGGREYVRVVVEEGLGGGEGTVVEEGVNSLDPHHLE